MSKQASFEEITTPSTPVEKWFADYRILLSEEVLEAPIHLAELKDDREEKEWWTLFYKGEIALARLQHLDALDLLCDPRFNTDTQINKLGDHIEELGRELTSRDINQDDIAHTMPAIEEAKLRAKITDTTSLRKIVARQ